LIARYAARLASRFQFEHFVEADRVNPVPFHVPRAMLRRGGLPAMRILVTCTLALELAACTQTVNIWSKPGFDQTTFNADWYQCQRENGNTTVTIDSGNAFSDATVQKSVTTNYPMANQCMMAKGYTIIRQEQRPAN
jgi:hypothetical protein